MIELSTPACRRVIVIQGIVQGVGFRPFVYGLASDLGLAGFVRNDSGGVTIEIEGTSERLDTFQRLLRSKAPPLSRIDLINIQPALVQGDTTFTIAPSQPGDARRALISPDVATCDDCLRELLDPNDRRFWYPFINCTNCGPRFTIIEDVPYDRGMTTMRVFAMCPECGSEYHNPRHRRFHAQPNACPRCGPSIRLEWRAEMRTDMRAPGQIPGRPGAEGRVLIYKAAHQLLAGEIVAIKGLGGYHLACDALNSQAVARLRERKQREAKPFALMVSDLDMARQLCKVSPAESTLLESRRRPIVLLQRRPDSPVVPEVAPGVDTLGLMLPYTPLHYLLLHAYADMCPANHPAALVMTSGNISDEPVVYKDADAIQQLSPITRHGLLHNREIHIRCDDSLARVVRGGEQLIRRSRGYVPEPIQIDPPFPMHVLACGGHLKNTFCLGRDHSAFLSHHIGDLQNLATLQSYREGIDHFRRLFDIQPEAVAYDLHPDYLSTQYALDFDSPLKLGVQHHHAHIAGVMAEYGLRGPVIGVAADGSGYGTDGAVWGGEVLLARLESFERFAHLAYVPLPGGEQAVRQPWRVAMAYLLQAYGDGFNRLEIPFTRRLDPARRRGLVQMIEHGLNCPSTSSLGRLFDAAAALLCLRSEVEYEGQAAIELEVAASSAPSADPASYPFEIQAGRPAQIDARPLIRGLVEDIQRGARVESIAQRFHRTVAAMLAEVCRRARAESKIETVALSGGVFQNRLLLDLLSTELESSGFQVLINRKTPPNDGGLAFGQAVVAAARLRQPAGPMQPQDVPTQ